ncbi:DUF2752 domain-containing protein [Bacteroidota bacterium]
MAGASFYFVLSLFLKAYFSIDILLPCLWKTIFHSNCWGCGLSTSFVHLLNFNFNKAYNAHPLVFIILIVAIGTFVSDLYQFKNKHYE